METQYSYDPERRWLESVHTVKGLEKYQDMSYSFDSVGNVTQMTNQAGRYSTTQTYGYDGLYQLTSAEGTYASKPHGYTEYTGSYSQQFNYDTLGNIISKISNSSVNPSQSQAIGAQLNYTLITPIMKMPRTRQKSSAIAIISMMPAACPSSNAIALRPGPTGTSLWNVKEATET